MKTRNIYLSLIAILVVAGGIVFALTTMRSRQEAASEPPPASASTDGTGGSAAESGVPNVDGKPAPEGCDFAPAGPLVAASAADYSVKTETTKIEETGSLPDGVKFRIESDGCVDALTYQVDLQSPDERSKRTPAEWLKWANDEVALLPFRSQNEFVNGFKRLLSTPEAIKFTSSGPNSDMVEVCNDGSAPGTGDKCTADDGSEADCHHECSWDEGYSTTFEVKSGAPTGTTTILIQSEAM